MYKNYLITVFAFITTIAIGCKSDEMLVYREGQDMIPIALHAKIRDAALAKGLLLYCRQEWSDFDCVKIRSSEMWMNYKPIPTQEKVVFCITCEEACEEDTKTIAGLFKDKISSDYTDFYLHPSIGESEKYEQIGAGIAASKVLKINITRSADEQFGVELLGIFPTSFRFPDLEYHEPNLVGIMKFSDFVETIPESMESLQYYMIIIFGDDGYDSHKKTTLVTTGSTSIKDLMTSIVADMQKPVHKPSIQECTRRIDTPGSIFYCPQDPRLNISFMSPDFGQVQRCLSDLITDTQAFDARLVDVTDMDEIFSAIYDIIFNSNSTKTPVDLSLCKSMLDRLVFLMSEDKIDVTSERLHTLSECRHILGYREINSISQPALAALDNLCNKIYLAGIERLKNLHDTPECYELVKDAVRVLAIGSKNIEINLTNELNEVIEKHESKFATLQTALLSVDSEA